jgi:hypothetical protein
MKLGDIVFNPDGFFNSISFPYDAHCGHHPCYRGWFIFCSNKFEDGFVIL